MEPPPLHYVSFCSFLGLFFLAFVKRRVPKTNRAKEPLKVSEKKISVFLYFPLELFSAILTAPSSFKSGWYFFFCKDKFIYVFMLKEFTQQGVIEVVLVWRHAMKYVSCLAHQYSICSPIVTIADPPEP